MSYLASCKFCKENAHTRNKQQTHSEIKRTQRSQCVKQTSVGARGEPRVWEDQKNVLWPRALNPHQSSKVTFFFKLTLQSDGTFLSSNTVNTGTVSYRCFPLFPVHVCSPPHGSSATLFVRKQYVRLHSTLVSRREQTDIVSSDLFCLCGMSTEATGGLASDTLVSQWRVNLDI